MLPSKKSGNTGASQKIIIYVEQRGKANKKKKKEGSGYKTHQSISSKTMFIQFSNDELYYTQQNSS
jgi:hypothetical protein